VNLIGNSWGTDAMTVE